MAQPQKPAVNQTHACPACGVESCCDLENGQTACWCFTRPLLKSTNLNSENQTQAMSGKCLCPSCLAAASAGRKY